MFRVTRCLLIVAGTSGVLFLSTHGAWAETWSDSTGKFRIEAEYVGVEGKSLVLRKPDGTTINVPIERLSAESRAKAKRLYEMAKSGNSAPLSGTTPATRPDSAATANSSSAVAAAASPLNFRPPSPVQIPPMAAFPEDASLQESVDFIRDQLLAGHPEVFWHALPEDLRGTLDSREFREKLIPYLQEQAKTNEPVEKIMLKAVEVLVKQKKFALNSPVLAQVPPPMSDMIRKGYDPAVGLIYEIFSLNFASKSIGSMTVTDMVDRHGPRIGGHLAALVKLAPPEMVEKFTSQIVVQQTDDTSGTITVPKQQGGTETIEMVKYQGRWIPKELADGWTAKKDTFIGDMVDAMKAAQQDPQAKQQASFLIGMLVGMADRALDPLLAAKSQQEFDQAVMQVMAAARGFGGGGPGGPPAGGPPAAPGQF